MTKCSKCQTFKKYRDLFENLISDYREELQANTNQRNELRELVMQTEELKCQCQLMSIDSKICIEKIKHMIRRQTCESKCLYELYLVEQGIMFMLSQELMSAFAREDNLCKVKKITEAAKVVVGLRDDDVFNPVLDKLTVMCRDLGHLEENIQEANIDGLKEQPPCEEVVEDMLKKKEELEMKRREDMLQKQRKEDEEREKKDFMPKGDEYEHKKREEALQRMRKGDKEASTRYKSSRSFSQSPDRGREEPMRHTSPESRSGETNQALRNKINLLKDALDKQLIEDEQKLQAKQVIEAIEHNLEALEGDESTEEGLGVSRESITSMLNNLTRKLSDINYVDFDNESLEKSFTEVNPKGTKSRSESGSEPTRPQGDDIQKPDGLDVSLGMLQKRLTNVPSDKDLTSDMKADDLWNFFKAQKDFHSETNTTVSDVWSRVVSEASTASSTLKSEKTPPMTPEGVSANAPFQNPEIELKVDAAVLNEVEFEMSSQLKEDQEPQVTVSSQKLTGVPRMSRKVSFMEEDPPSVVSDDDNRRFSEESRRRRSSTSSTSSSDIDRAFSMASMDVKVKDLKDNQTLDGYYIFDTDDDEEDDNESDDASSFYKILPPAGHQVEVEKTDEVIPEKKIGSKEAMPRRVTTRRGKSMAWKDSRRNARRKDTQRAALAINYKSPLSPPPSLRNKDAPPFLEEARRKKTKKTDSNAGNLSKET